jgi:hypothetical protein
LYEEFLVYVYNREKQNKKECGSRMGQLRWQNMWRSKH